MWSIRIWIEPGRYEASKKAAIAAFRDMEAIVAGAIGER
jgi:hypothetical protein